MANINEIILRITGEDDDASSVLEKFAAKLAAFGRQDETVELKVETSEAEGELLAFQRAAKAITGDVPIEVKLQDEAGTLASFATLIGTLNQINDDVVIKAELSDSSALAKLAQLEAAKEVAGRDIHIEADVDTGGATAHLLAFFGAITALKAAGNIVIDVETNAENVVQGAVSIFGVFTNGVKLAQNAASSFGQAVSGLAVNFGPFSAAMSGTLAIVLLLVGALIVQLVGALAAVAASAALAAAAVVALGTAFVAAMGPAVLVAVAVFARLVKIMQAVKAADQEAQNAAKTAAQHHEEARHAEEARADAARTLADAETSLGKATTQAYQDMADAATRAKQAVDSLARARLSQEQANLNVQKAKLELEKFRKEVGLTGKDLDNTFKKFSDVNFDPKKLNKELAKVGTDKTLGQEQELQLKQLILNIKDARLSQKEATNGVTNAQTDLNRATKTYNDYIRLGIKANPGYLAALKQRNDALRAQRRLAADQKDAREQAKLTKAEQLTKKLSATELAFAAALKEAKAAFSALFTPAVEAILTSTANAFKIIAGAVKPLKPAFSRLGALMGGAIEQLAAAIANPAIIAGIGTLIDLAGQLSGPITQGLISLFTILMNIATAAAPFLLPIFQGIADFLGVWAQRTADTGKMSDFIQLIVDNLGTWWDLINSVAQALLDFFIAAGPEGQILLDKIIALVDNFDRMLNTKEGRQEVIDWLKNAVGFAIDFLNVVLAIIQAFVVIGGITVRLINIIKSAVNWVDKWLQKIDRIETRWVNALNNVGDAIGRFIAGALRTLNDAVTGFFSSGKNLGEAIIHGLANGMLGLAGKLISGAVTSLGGAIKNGLKGVLHIKSPSKVMQEIGVNVTEGLALGMKDGGRKLEHIAEVSMARPIIRGAVPQVAVPGGQQGEGGNTFIDKIEVASPNGGLGDERAAAMMFARELRRRGR